LSSFFKAFGISFHIFLRMFILDKKLFLEINMPISTYLRLNSKDYKRNFTIDNDKKSIKFIVENNSTNSNKNICHNSFAFSRIFDQKSSQSEIFQNVIVQSCDEFISNKNQLIYTEGPTFGGKTFTMFEKNINVVGDEFKADDLGAMFNAIFYLSNSVRDQLVSNNEQYKYYPSSLKTTRMLSDNEVKTHEEIKKNILDKNIKQYSHNMSGYSTQAQNRNSRICLFFSAYEIINGNFYF
jgi:hypothetical protein